MTFKPGPNNHLLLNAKIDNFGRTGKLLREAKLTQLDVGKIFYSDPKKEKGVAVSREDFLLMNPDDIGGWTEITMFDVEL